MVNKMKKFENVYQDAALMRRVLLRSGWSGTTGAWKAIGGMFGLAEDIWAIAE